MNDALSNIAGAVGVFSNPISSLLSNYVNQLNADRINKQAQDFAISQWKRENEYNLPSNQVQRLQDAGLNPALMYQNGTMPTASATSPHLSLPAPANFLGVDPLTAAQIANLDAQTKATEDANIRENEKQSFNLELLDKQIDRMSAEIKNFHAEYDKILSEDYRSSAEGRKANIEADYIYRQWQFYEETFLERIQQFRNIARKDGIDADKAQEELNNLHDTLKSLIALNWSHIDYFRKTGAAQSSRAEAYASEVAGKVREIEGQLERWDDMTTNERIEMGVSVFNSLLGLAKSLFTTSRVTETVKQTTGKTTRTYQRKRSAK